MAIVLTDLLNTTGVDRLGADVSRLLKLHRIDVLIEPYRGCR